MPPFKVLLAPYKSNPSILSLLPFRLHLRRRRRRLWLGNWSGGFDAANDDDETSEAKMRLQTAVNGDEVSKGDKKK